MAETEPADIESERARVIWHDTVHARALVAHAANRAYLAAPIPSTVAARLSAVESQVAALTRQVNALIRLTVGDLTTD
jgi:hypothetical protein